MWLRNALFGGLCLVGVAAVAANLLNADRLTEASAETNERPRNLQGVAEIVDRVNQEFAAAIAARGLHQAEAAPDLKIARRLSLGLAGTIPSLEEIRAFEELPAAQRLDWWVSRLLQDRRYSMYVAERLARAYVGTEDGPFIVFRRRRFVTWLSDQLQANTRYDVLARQLIAGTGLWTDSPSVNFLTVTIDDSEDEQPDEIRLAGRTTRAFLGMRIDCLQCHDDRLGNVELGDQSARFGEQQDFHKLAAFFAPARISLLGIQDDANQSYAYQYLHADQEETIEPDVPFAASLLQGAGPLRERLASWVTHPDNRAFSRAAVNRVWALMFGRPLVDPIDNIPLRGPYPPGLETLAQDFSDNGYDLRRLIRVIAATDVFRRSSAADFEVTPEHETHYAVFPLTRLRPEQVAGALLQGSSLTTIDVQSHIFAQLLRFLEQNEFVERYGDRGEDEFNERSGTVTQRLLLMNGDLVKDRTQRNLLRNAATRISVLADDADRAVETAYLCVLSRRPSHGELDHFRQRVEPVRQNARSRVLEDLYWVLLNSTEFSWNH